jgi:hypothetical protein
MWLSAYSTDARDPLHLGPSPVVHSLAMVAASTARSARDLAS